MTIRRPGRFVRVVLALLLAIGVSASLTARQTDTCQADCGDGCKIVVVSCPGGCTADSANCTIYWNNASCANNFFCSAGCTWCETFEN